jgi:hypothetical protein
MTGGPAHIWDCRHFGSNLYSIDGRAVCTGLDALFTELSAGLDPLTFDGRMELKRRAQIS